MTAFKTRFYTTSGALGLGPVILKMPENIILKALGRPGPHYFKSFPVHFQAVQSENPAGHTMTSTTA